MEVKATQPLTPHFCRMLPGQHHGCFQGASWILPSSENRMWAAAINPNPGEGGAPYRNGLHEHDCGQTLYMQNASHSICQAIAVLGGGTSYPLEVLMVGAQVWGDDLPLNKISDTPSNPLRDRKPSWEQTGHGDQVPINYPHWGIMTHVLKVKGWRVNFIEFPLRATLGVPPSLSLRCWVQVTSYDAVGQQIQGVQEVQGDPPRWWWQSSCKGPGTLGVTPPVEAPGSSDELVAAPVRMAASRLGTPTVWRRAAF